MLYGYSTIWINWRQSNIMTKFFVRASCPVDDHNYTHKKKRLHRDHQELTISPGNVLEPISTKYIGWSFEDLRWWNHKLYDRNLQNYGLHTNEKKIQKSQELGFEFWLVAAELNKPVGNLFLEKIKRVVVLKFFIPTLRTSLGIRLI